MSETNRCEFIGIISNLRKIPTKTGRSMCKWLLAVGEHKFWCVGFQNIADEILRIGEGERIGVIGSAAADNWKDREGRWQNTFQLNAWRIIHDGQETCYTKPGAQQEQREVNEHAYVGGPF